MRQPQRFATEGEGHEDCDVTQSTAEKQVGDRTE